MRIALVGAGGVGAGFGAYLAQAGHDVVAIARGRHRDAIARDGLIVRRADGDVRLPITVSDRMDELGPVDLVLFAVKLWDTEETARQLAPVLSPETTVLVLQNGVEALALLEPIIGRERLVAGVAQISAVIEAPGIVAHRSPFARIVAGDLPGAGRPGRLADLVRTLSDTGIEAVATDQPEVELWNKFVLIVGLSGATAYFRSPIGPIRDDPETLAFLEALVAEAVAVGIAEGVALSRDQAARTMGYLCALPPPIKASMYEDLLAGNRLELPWLSGRVVRGGRAHGVPTPANAAVTLALKLHAAGAPRP